MEMQVMKEVNTLLIEIQHAVGCPYLSDLHSDCRLLNKLSKELLLAIPLERYPLQNWNEAATYITGQRCSFASLEEARAKIVAAM